MGSEVTLEGSEVIWCDSFQIAPGNKWTFFSAVVMATEPVWEVYTCI